MKCPQCASDSNKKERAAANGCCPKCGRRFVFDPPEPLSDAQVAEAVAKLSKKDALRYTRAQLVCEVDRTIARREHTLAEVAAIAAADIKAPVTMLVVGVVAATVLGLSVSPIFFVFGGLIALLAVTSIVRSPSREAALEAAEARRLPRAALTDADTLAHRWLSAERPKLLLPATSTRPAPAKAREFDLDSYGFDRVVVVQGDDLVDCLVANQFHVEHNAAVVSFTGYPSHVADLVLKQLRESPAAATLYLLHDASTEGYEMAEKWLSNARGAKIVRVGLSPRQVEKIEPRFAATKAPAAAMPEALKTFLSQHRVPLAALRPEQLMILLFNAMSQADRAAVDQPIVPGEMGIILYDGDWSTVADAPYDFG